MKINLELSIPPELERLAKELDLSMDRAVQYVLQDALLAFHDSRLHLVKPDSENFKMNELRVKLSDLLFSAAGSHH